MQPNDFVKCLAALVAWREEAINGLNGMLGVLFVIRRRAVTWYEGDWAEAIETHGQFSSMTILGDGQTVKYPDVRDPVFQKILQWVDPIYGTTGSDGQVEDKITNGALYYADLSNPGFQKDGWFDRNILQKPDEHPRVAQIGTTTYFK